jgi:uncharacterized protein YabE (DUF348 family)
MSKKSILSNKPQKGEAKVDKRPLHKHPLVVPVSVLLASFFLGCAAFIFLNGHTVEPADSHLVHMHVDGQDRALPTRAATVGDFIKRLDISVQPHDVVEPALDTAITDDNFQVNIYRAKPVTVIDNGKKVTTVTAQQSPRDIAKGVGLEVYPEDKVSATPTSDPLAQGLVSQNVVIDRATPANINLYGNSIPVRTRSKTVGDLLAEKSIKPLAGDTITPSANTPLGPNTQIFVVRVGKQIDTKEEVIPMQIITQDDPSLAFGQKQTKEPGSNGKKLVTYEVETKNGKEASRRVIQEVVAVAPVNQIVLKGTKIVETRISGDKSALLTAAGVPTSQQFAADFVISKESGWNLASRNGSGCLGLGQACPGSKLIAACPSWSVDANCQIRFFSDYASRYGGWNGAYQFWLVNHWW